MTPCLLPASMRRRSDRTTALGTIREVQPGQAEMDRSVPGSGPRHPCCAPLRRPHRPVQRPYPVHTRPRASKAPTKWPVSRRRHDGRPQPNGPSSPRHKRTESAGCRRTSPRRAQRSRHATAAPSNRPRP
jgi:hypothetical protein